MDSAGRRIYTTHRTGQIYGLIKILRKELVLTDESRIAYNFRDYREVKFHDQMNETRSIVYADYSCSLKRAHSLPGSTVLYIFQFSQGKYPQSFHIAHDIVAPSKYVLFLHRFFL